MTRRRDIYVVGYLGSGYYNGASQPIWGQPLRDENGVREVGGGQAIHPLTLEEAEEEITELSTRVSKAIYKLVIVKRFKR